MQKDAAMNLNSVQTIGVYCYFRDSLRLTICYLA